MQQKTSAKITYFVSVLGIFAFCFSYATQRLVGRDEGFYTMAGKLVSEGQLPYLDFFYPQMPLIPFLFAGWFKIFGVGWIPARYLVALLTALTGSMLCWWIVRRAGSRMAIIFSLVFISCNFIYPWFLTAQSYAPTIFFTTIAFLLAHSNRPFSILVAGLMLGLATCSRLYVITLVPVFLLHFMFLHDPTGTIRMDYRSSFKHCAIFLVGIAIGLIPALYFLLHDSDTFWFNNLGYHLHRPGRELPDSLLHKFKIFRVLLGVSESIKFDALHMPLLLWSALFFFIRNTFLNKQLPSLALLIAGTLFIVSFIPNPAYVQYFCLVVPFLLIYVLEAFGTWIRRPNGPVSPLRVALIVIVALAVYTPGTITDLLRYARTGDGVIGIRTQEKALHWNLATIRSVNQMVARNVDASSFVATLWPGYLLEVDAPIEPGLENHFGAQIASQVPPRERSGYHLLGRKDLVKLIESRHIQYMLVSTDGNARRIITTLEANGYRKVDSESFLTLYAPPR